MSLTDALARPLTSALALSVLGFGGAQTLEQQVDEILETEAVSGDAVAQYNQQDLTSMFVETDGSGGNPSVGDSVGFIADTARFEGKTFDQFVSGQTELVANNDFATGDFTGWSESGGGDWVYSGGRAEFGTYTGNSNLEQTILTVGEYYAVSIVHDSTSGSLYLRGFGSQRQLSSAVTSGQQYILEATQALLQVHGNSAGATGEGFSNLTVKHIPGYHLIAASDAARPVLLDSFDQSGAALTDNGGRGEELVENGGFDGDVVGFSARSNATLSYNSSEGAAEVNITGSGGGLQDDQTITTEPGAEYEVTVSVKQGTYTGDINFSLDGDNTTFSLTGSYASHTRTYRAVDADLEVTLTRATATTGTFFVASISVKRISTTFDGQANLVTNGTFDTDTDWTKGTGWSIGSGVATGATAATLYQDSVATASKWHRFVFYVSSYTSGTITPNLGGASGASVSSAGWHVQYIRANGSRANLLGSSFVGSIDNVIVQEVPSSIERIYFLSTDGSDDQIETDFTGSSSDTIVMAVRTSDAEGILLRGDATTRYLLAIDDGNASATLHGDAGTPTLRLDGAAWSPASQDAVHTDLSDDNWHVVTVQAADFSSWSKVILGFFDTSSSFNTAMDIAYGPVILPDPSAEDLATIEQAAAAACGVTLA